MNAVWQNQIQKHFVRVTLLVGFAAAWTLTAQETEMTFDPIAVLVEDLSASHGAWRNGLVPDLGLAGDTPIEALVARRFETPLLDGKISQFDVVDSRNITITERGVELPRSDYTAVLVNTNLGQKIVILRFNVASGKWFNKVFDSPVPPSAVEQPAPRG
jgi:hypothetical protein